MPRKDMLKEKEYSLAKEKNAKNFLYEVLFRRFCPGYKFSKVIINSVHNDKYSTSELAMVAKFFF